MLKCGNNVSQQENLRVGGGGGRAIMNVLLYEVADVRLPLYVSPTAYVVTSYTIFTSYWIVIT